MYRHILSFKQPAITPRVKETIVAMATTVEVFVYGQSLHISRMDKSQMGNATRRKCKAKPFQSDFCSGSFDINSPQIARLSSA